MNEKIRVFVVDDSLLFRKVLIDNLSQNPNIEVVGYAIDAFDAERKIPVIKPDVVTVDVEMPRLNGIDFVKKLLPNYPVPVILVSSLNLNVFEALSAGAVDFVRKPDMSASNTASTFINTLISKIFIASRARIRVPGVPSPIVSQKPVGTGRPFSLNAGNTVIAIGASTGGTEATLQVLKNLPPDTPGIVVTQHMPEGFTKMYADRLNHLCQMNVKEAQTGDVVERGQVLIAPGDLQMKVIRSGSRYTVSCFSGEKVSGHRPSVDVLFQSVADAAGASSVGIIMTGMGRDGADGLLKMKKKGAFTIGQDAESCVVYGMPMVAYNIGAVTVQTACSNISNVLLKHLYTL
ncbi:protein-glutamate methylesterase/protein-glutamine glutaminase [Lacrimispora saccharolytica]|uniref:Protein-glutamate methylesterase/protein-glutamine glutaminase n=1 Tax=Lacrimispora saccharolytica (strain ATCC 35040 / DSM 2544 / NRCC 2533 / WM1) TaxID=610130 RepID=D9R9Y0_LACSW|nr:chemotaxis response regulator protein-glutamate methylesterase [Lacrimispora saccharolytica]ADL05952.1 response regulator receiver modulated CheB methylesterase [[Clostridium] saccharolyticum WM1]QRV19918.1 chemotaxis response regulator protein-glutamate methylesterase [Lacrimispora saccharolytica]